MLLPFCPAKQVTVALTRLFVLQTADAWKQQGRTMTEFCRAAGISAPTLWRWRKRLASHDLAGLLPPTPGRRQFVHPVLNGLTRAWVEFVLTAQSNATPQVERN